ncbi:D123-domain-containing protein [Flagelloscypha sp. PMI_526]|nr:D123-domain-containing protein [Flagelloscypha sp. PMI_526]
MALFPNQTRDYILAFQFSSWYPRFSSISIKSTIISPLPEEFRAYLNADSVFVPQGSDNFDPESQLSDDEDSASEDSDEPSESFSFPDLDAQIRACIDNYTAVFPKLNFSSPKDASWILPPSSPLKCTSPADVYLLLKSSDFISHDLDESNVFSQCESSQNDPNYPYVLELVLRKWYPVDRSRELRCFVRDNALIALCPRDTNYYDFWNELETQSKVTVSVHSFWEREIKPKWTFHADYIFDFLLTRDLSTGHIIDFSPYSGTTDSLLFSYDDLQALSSSASAPLLRVIDSRTHPAAISNAPTNQHNMIPFEALALGNGRTIEEFADAFRDEVQKSIH